MRDRTPLETLQHQAICYLLNRVMSSPDLAHYLLDTEAHLRLVEAEANYREVETAVLLKERRFRTARGKAHVEELQERVDELEREHFARLVAELL